MDVLRTAVSFLGMEDAELGKDDISTPAGRQRSQKMPSENCKLETAEKLVPGAK
jgi:hypothetical protein